MKRMFVVLLCILLLAGCTKAGIVPESAPVPAGTGPLSAETAAVGTTGSAAGPAPTQPADPGQPEAPVSGDVEALQSEDCYLFFRQDQIREDSFDWNLTGDLVTDAELRAWCDGQTHLPRTHYYDESFSDQPLLLDLMDYCISQGYAGVAAPLERVDLTRVTEDQWKKLFWIYRVDDAIPMYVPANRTDESAWCGAVWLACTRPDTMERFSAGMEKAREIVSQIPEGLNDYDTAYYLYQYLKTHIKYDPLSLNYYSFEWYLLYDALIEGKCVCTGFSDALYYLYNLAGIDCICVSGYVEASEYNEGQNHQWNVAELYGTYYCFDATWDSNAAPIGENTYFAVSEAMMNSVSQRTYNQALADLFPVCDTCFVPPEEWGETPEGALRCFLWLREYCCGTKARSFLVQTGQLGHHDPPLRVLAGQIMVYDIPYESFLETIRPYVTELCYNKEFEGRYYRNEDGNLGVYAGTGSGVRYRVVSVSGSGSSYTAQLVTENGTAATATFTVQEEDGRYKISTIRIQQN